MSMSADGFVGGLNGQGDWIANGSDETSRKWAVEHFSQAGAILVGRKTFQGWATYWPQAGGPFAKPMNEIPKIVFSRNGLNPAKIEGVPEEAKTWKEATVLTGDMAQEITALKKQPGKDLIATGGVDFVQSLMQTGQIDEYCFVLHSVILGQGVHLFSALKATIPLELISSRAFPAGGVVNIYKPKN